MTTHGNTALFGICNVAFFSTRPEGSRTYYGTRAERDAALVSLRERAIDRGLSVTAAECGIYPVRTRAAVVRRIADGHHVRLSDDLECAMGAA